MLKVHSDIDNCTMLKLRGKVAKKLCFCFMCIYSFDLQAVLSICCHVY